MGLQPLDTAPPLLYPRSHRNPPWRDPHPATPEKKFSRTVNVLPRNRVYVGRGSPDPSAVPLVPTVPQPNNRP